MTQDPRALTNDVRTGAFADLADMALDTGIGRVAPSRAKGSLGMAMTGLSAVSEVATTGSVSKSTMLGTASSAALMVGARLVPGVGWAMAAYTAADLGSRAFLGKPFGETMIGRPIDWAAGQLGRGTLGVAKATTDLIGWKGASEFLENTVYPWAFPDDAKKGTASQQSPQQRLEDRIEHARASGLLPDGRADNPVLLKGPSLPMGPDDWHEHAPSTPAAQMPAATKAGSSRLAMAELEPGQTLPTINPDPDDILARRTAVLSRDSAAIQQTQDLSQDAALHSSVEGSAVRRSDIFKAALADQENQSDPALPLDRTPSPKKQTGIEIDD